MKSHSYKQSFFLQFLGNILSPPERVYLSLYKVTDTPFHIQGDEYFQLTISILVNFKIINCIILKLEHNLI